METFLEIIFRSHFHLSRRRRHRRWRRWPFIYALFIFNFSSKSRTFRHGFFSPLKLTTQAYASQMSSL